MTQLYRLSFTINRDQSNEVELIIEAIEPAPLSIARFEEPSGQTWVVEALFATPPEQNNLKKKLRHGLGFVPPFDLAPLPNQDWVARSLEGLKPVEAGRFLIHGAHDAVAERTGKIAIKIEAGAAFGTGHHATTCGCLIALEHTLKTIPIRRTLDIGTGTGILAIAAAKMTKSKIIATDIDPVSVRIAKINAALNQVGSLVIPYLAHGLSHPNIMHNAPYDLIIANILAQPIIKLAAPAAKIASHRNITILSGLLKHQERAVSAAWRAQGFVRASRLEIDGWSTLTLTRIQGGNSLLTRTR